MTRHRAHALCLGASLADCSTAPQFAQSRERLSVATGAVEFAVIVVVAAAGAAIAFGIDSAAPLFAKFVACAKDSSSVTVVELEDSIASAKLLSFLVFFKSSGSSLCLIRPVHTRQETAPRPPALELLLLAS